MTAPLQTYAIEVEMSTGCRRTLPETFTSSRLAFQFLEENKDFFEGDAYVVRQHLYDHNPKRDVRWMVTVHFNGGNDDHPSFGLVRRDVEERQFWPLPKIRDFGRMADDPTLVEWHHNKRFVFTATVMGRFSKEAFANAWTLCQAQWRAANGNYYPAEAA